MQSTRHNFKTIKECFAAAQDKVLAGKPKRDVDGAISDYSKKCGWASKRATGAPVEQTPMDLIRQAEAQIRSALKGLDAERDQLHRRLKELDNTVDRYKRMLDGRGGNGHTGGDL
jgi:hypothetical protein